MTYAYFAPKDLREVDPRPAPTLISESETVRELLSARLSGEDLSRALQALGLVPYERAFNPAARDAWTRPKKPAHPKRDAARKLACPQGHDRQQFSTEDRGGRMYCMICKKADGERRRELARQRRNAA